MIQDIAPHTYHNEYKPVAPDKESHILAYEEGKILMKKDGETMTLPSFGELEGKVENLYENYIYLFSIDEEHFYLIPDLDTVCAVPQKEKGPQNRPAPVTSSKAR